MDGGVGDALAEAGDDTDGDQERGVGLGQGRGQQRQHRRGRDPEQEDPLAPVLGREVAPGDLGDDVAVEEAGEDEALGPRVPVKVRDLKSVKAHERKIKLVVFTKFLKATNFKLFHLSFDLFNR